MMSGLFGACLFMYGMPIRRKGLYGFVIFLIVADEWVSHPANDKQKEYSEAEAVYRKFVYDNYTKADVICISSSGSLF